MLLLHKVILLLENFVKNASKSSLFCITMIMVHKSMNDSYVLKTPIQEKDLGHPYVTKFISMHVTVDGVIFVMA